MARIAHVVLSHRGVDQVERLVRRLSEGSHNDLVLVHHDPTGEPWPQEALADCSNVCFVPARPVVWGHWSHVEALLRAFEVALGFPDVRWVIVHSGQDYPLAPSEIIHARLENSDCDGFLVVEPPFHSEKELQEFERRSRYHYVAIPRAIITLPFPTMLRRVFRFGARVVNHSQPMIRFSIDRFWRRPLIGFRTSDRWLRGRTLHKSSDWMILSRNAVATVIDASTDRRFVRRYRATLCPSESFFATVLANDQEVELCSNDLRFIRWTGGIHPEILTADDFEAMIASECLFARKFDAEVDGHVLDLIDEHLSALREGPPRSSPERNPDRAT